MNKRFRDILIATLTFSGGIYFFLEFLLPKTVLGYEFGKYNSQITDGAILVGAMAIGLGIINLVRVHGLNILQTKAGWFNSFALLLGMFIVFGIEMGDFFNAETRSQEVGRLSNLVRYVEYFSAEPSVAGKTKLEHAKLLSAEIKTLRSRASDPESFLFLPRDNPEKLLAVQSFDESFDALEASALGLETNYQVVTPAETMSAAEAATIRSIKLAAAAATDIAEYNFQRTKSRVTSHFVFEAFFVPLGSAMFSLLAFYVATAAYRTFRVHSFEAMIMMVAAIVVILGQIPQGPMYISKDLPNVRNWLMEYLSNPAFRAIFFGSMIASLAMAIRMWLSLEKSPLAVDDDS